jgi:hypothetical protein
MVTIGIVVMVTIGIVTVRTHVYLDWVAFLWETYICYDDNDDDILYECFLQESLVKDIKIFNINLWQYWYIE